MTTSEWREEPSGTFAADTDDFSLQVRRRSNGKHARFVIFKRYNAARDALVDSGVREDLSAAMIAAETSVERLSKIARRHSLLVLVVNQNQIMRGAIADVVRRDGYDTVEAASMEGALRRLEHTSRPILLIYAVQTKDGSDAREFAAAARKIRSSVDVLFISGNPLCYCYMSKENFLVEPFSADQLLRRVGTVGARHQVATPIGRASLARRHPTSWLKAGWWHALGGGSGEKQ